jgi:hypothetical protein
MLSIPDTIQGISTSVESKAESSKKASNDGTEIVEGGKI